MRCATFAGRTRAGDVVPGTVRRGDYRRNAATAVARASRHLWSSESMSWLRRCHQLATTPDKNGAMRIVSSAYKLSCHHEASQDGTSGLQRGRCVSGRSRASSLMASSASSQCLSSRCTRRSSKQTSSVGANAWASPPAVAKVGPAPLICDESSCPCPRLDSVGAHDDSTECAARLRSRPLPTQHR